MLLTNLIYKTGRIGHYTKNWLQIIWKFGVLFEAHGLNFSTGSSLNRLHFMRSYRKVQPGFCKFFTLGDLMIIWPKNLNIVFSGILAYLIFFIFLWFYSGWSYCADTGKQLKPLICSRAKGRLSFTAEQRNVFGTHRPQFLVHTSQVLKVS